MSIYITINDSGLTILTAWFQHSVIHLFTLSTYTNDLDLTGWPIHSTLYINALDLTGWSIHSTLYINALDLIGWPIHSTLYINALDLTGWPIHSPICTNDAGFIDLFIHFVLSINGKEFLFIVSMIKNDLFPKSICRLILALSLLMMCPLCTGSDAAILEYKDIRMHRHDSVHVLRLIMTANICHWLLTNEMTLNACHQLHTFWHFQRSCLCRVPSHRALVTLFIMHVIDFQF